MNDTQFDGSQNPTPSGPISSSRILNNSQDTSLGAGLAESIVSGQESTTAPKSTTTTPTIPRSKVATTTSLKLNLGSGIGGIGGIGGIKTTTTTANSDQALLSAVYNTIAIGLLVICVGLCALLFVVLQAFVRSILWALLTSACLFSLKRFLTELARRRLDQIETSGSTLALEFALLPFRLIDSGVDWTWDLMQRRWRQFLALAFILLIFNLGSVFSYGPLGDAVLTTSIHMFSWAHRISELLTYYADNMWMLTCSLVIAYVLAITFYWQEKYTTLFQIMSLPVWSSVLFLSSSLMGSYRPLFLFTFGLLVLIGLYSFVFEYVSNLRRKLTRTAASVTNDTASLSSSAANTPRPNVRGSVSDEEFVENVGSLYDDSADTKMPENSQSHSNSFLKTTILNLYQTSMHYWHGSSPDETNTTSQGGQETVGGGGDKSANRAQTPQPEISRRRISRRNKENSDKYFIVLFWLLVCAKLRYDLFILVPFVVIVWKVAKHALRLVLDLIGSSGKCELVKEWFVRRREILAPRVVRLLVKFFRKGDHKCIQVISHSMDTIVTGLIMVALFLAIVCSAIILCIQVQSETTQLMSFGSEILNEQLYSKPEWHQWLPEKERLNKLFHTMIKNFHLHGREWLSRSLKSIDPNPNPNSNNSDYILLEAQILEQWDSLYAYLSRQATSSTSTNLNYTNLLAPISVPPKIGPSTNSIETPVLPPNHRSVGTQTTASKSTWFWANYKHLAVLLKDNLGVFMSIVDSLYQIFKGNLNLVATILWTLVSTVLSSGFALANFFVSFLVYVSVVFYLLSSSKYKPFQWLAEFKLIEQHNLTSAIEDSIRSVFVASIKMAAFFGIYTYTVNSIFSVSIIYLPSIMAGLFAFLPLLGTYWVAVPGILELWLVQNRPIAAVLFFIAHLAPTLIAVDKAIYSEIKAGHPYLTGLAFAGGVYCLGLEGALIGPIVLCLLIVIGRIITQANLSEHFTNLKAYQLIRTPSVECRPTKPDYSSHN